MVMAVKIVKQNQESAVALGDVEQEETKFIKHTKFAMGDFAPLMKRMTCMLFIRSLHPKLMQEVGVHNHMSNDAR